MFNIIFATSTMDTCLGQSYYSSHKRPKIATNDGGSSGGDGDAREYNY